MMLSSPDTSQSKKTGGKDGASQRLDSMLKMPSARSANNLAALKQMQEERANLHLPTAGKQVIDAPSDAPKGRIPSILRGKDSQQGPLAVPPLPGEPAAPAPAASAPAPAAMPAVAPEGMPNAVQDAPGAAEVSQAPEAAQSAAKEASGEGSTTDAPATGTPVGKITPAKVPASEAIPGTPPGTPLSTPSGAMPGKPGAPAQQEDHIWREIWGFIRSIFVKSETEQRPSMSPMQAASNFLAARRDGDPKAMQQGAIPGLFAAMDAPLHGLTPDDIQFANEVDKALARRPRFGVRVLSVTVFCMFVILIIWAALATVDEVTHAEGSVVGSQRTQSIQNLEGGILRELKVREGEIVEAKTVLAIIDNEMAASSYRDVENKILENVLAIERLNAEAAETEPNFSKSGTWANEVLGKKPSLQTIKRIPQIIEDQRKTWESRKQQLEADVDVLKSQYEQRKREVQEQSARKVQLEKSLELAIQQRDSAEKLLKRNNYSRMEFLNLEQKIVDFQGQVDMLEASIPKAEAAAMEAQQRISSRMAEQRAAISEEIGKRRLELTSLHETMQAGRDRVTRTEVRSPVYGTVKQIHINTMGGVIKPGEPIMDIVPMDDTVLVEAKVMPKDVAFLRPGQDAMVKVSAYDFNIYGGLEGKLESISADTVEDKKGEFHYIVKVRTPKNTIIYHNEKLPVIPGMMVTADILIGKKTILDYLIKPIMKAKQNALRER